ncbi:hypothetical protein niasHT_013305 [Heterodera trifolii]|uniref:DNA-directed DNA polymerase n=1 Tax=Heterodera trifolii TaxID=157864 RepID=A0ABD2LB54_9BILA
MTLVLTEYLENRSLEVTAIEELDEQHILISYEKKKEWIEEHACSNILISVWTTSAARLLLLKSMQKVVRTPSCQLLYTDTDSIILTHPDDNCPLKTGPHLGQFTDEYPKHEILEFCSGGAKQYGLKLRRKDAPADADLEYVLKVRGFTLNYDVVKNQGLRYETFKEQVLRYAETGERQPINRRVNVGVKELELKMDGLTIKSGTNSEQMPEANPQPFDHSINSTSALLPTNIGAGGTHISFGTAFASEFLTDAKNRLNAKIEEIEARILYLLARESKLNALNQLSAEIEREVNVLENMFP